MNKFVKYKVISLLDKDLIDMFIDTLYARLKTIKSDIDYQVEHGTNLTSVSFELDKLQPFYQFQIAQAAKIANLPAHSIDTTRRGNKVIVRVKN